jgi:hypothetical protein
MAMLVFVPGFPQLMTMIPDEHDAMIHLEASSVLVEWLGEHPNLEIMFHLGK